jgi:hypothetical protein
MAKETLVLRRCRALVFGRVATDNSRKVRAAALCNMGLVAAALKKSLAPHLKTVMGCASLPPSVRLFPSFLSLATPSALCSLTPRASL